MRIIIVPGIVLATAIVFSTPAKTQSPTSIAQVPTTDTACLATTLVEQRALSAAKNEARQMAEVTNGGLGIYRAEPTMHGAVIDAPCEIVSPGVWRFTFRGGDPVAVSTMEDYTILSVVTVSSASGASRSISLEYNGPIADYSGLPPAISQPSVEAVPEDIESSVDVSSETACVAKTPAEQRALNAAKNTARQAAESENGGLWVYRAEPAMYGPVMDAPCEVIGPSTWRFTFRGGEPAAVSILGDYTLLSVVTVEGLGRDRTTTLEYNGPIEDYDEQPLINLIKRNGR